MQEKDGKITVEVFPDRKTVRKEFKLYYSRSQIIVVFKDVKILFINPSNLD